MAKVLRLGITILAAGLLFLTAGCEFSGGSGNQAAPPLFAPSTACEFSLYQLIAPAMPAGYRVRLDPDNYAPAADGAYFVFLSPEDKALDDPSINESLTTLDVYMREQGFSDLKLNDALGVVLLAEGSTIAPREVWAGVEPAGSDLTFGQALRLYWDYDKTGAVFEPLTTEVVPLYYQNVDPDIIWYDPYGTEHTGLCYYIRNRLQPCYRPAASGSFFVHISDYEGKTLSTDMTSNITTLEDWARENQAGAYSFVQKDQVFIDGIDIRYDKFGKILLDGIFSMPVYASCLPGDPNLVETCQRLFPSDESFRKEILKILPHVEPYDSDGDGVAGPEFYFVKEGGVRIDVHLRSAAGIEPAEPGLETIDLDDPRLGDFFTLLPCFKKFSL